MRFGFTSDGHIFGVPGDLPGGADPQGGIFASEQELREKAGAWPMKRLVAIWNELPGLRAVQRFENRDIAITRIWRALEQQRQQSRGSALFSCETCR